MYFIHIKHCRYLVKREVPHPLPDGIVDMCVTSPPYYGLRDYGINGQIGLEKTPDEYISRLIDVFHEVHRVLKTNGTLWIVIGDSYCGTGSKGNYRDPINNKGRNGQSKSVTAKLAGYKPKDLIGIPWMLAFALRADGWFLRQDIIWHKPNCTPENITDRCTKAHEYIFLFSKSPSYYFDNDAIKEPAVSTNNRQRDRKNARLNKVPGRTFMGGLTKNDYTKRNKRDVWTIPTRPYNGAHFAVFPADLIRPCILAGSRQHEIVIDPFLGSGTTAEVCIEENRDYLGIEINPEYVRLANERIARVKAKPYQLELAIN